MTDEEAFAYIIKTARQIADTVDKNITQTEDISLLMQAIAFNIAAMTVALQGDPTRAPTAIIGLALMLKRKDLINKLVLINALNTKETAS